MKLLLFIGLDIIISYWLWDILVERCLEYYFVIYLYNVSIRNDLKYVYGILINFSVLIK